MTDPPDDRPDALDADEERLRIREAWADLEASADPRVRTLDTVEPTP